MDRKRSSRIIPLAVALGLGAVLMQGCARSAASDWAQLSPAIRPLPASETTVHLGVSGETAKARPADEDVEPEIKPGL